MHTRTRTHAHTHTCTHASTHTHIHTQTHTHTDPQTYAHTHTHIHARTHTYKSLCQSSMWYKTNFETVFNKFSFFLVGCHNKVKKLSLLYYLPIVWGKISMWVVSSPMARETRVQSQVESYQRLKKWYLILSCLTLSIKRSKLEQSGERSSTLPYTSV